MNYSYNIGEYDVTAGQYAAFLNAVASTSDPYGLYNSAMSGLPGCGITQSSGPGGYTYTTNRNPNYPVNFVNWDVAAQFCNWLTNGQPTGAERSGTTETGSYTLTTAVLNGSVAVTRNANAVYVLPTLNEWYKAAYYGPTLNGGAGGYWEYATQSDTAPSNILSATGTNNANFFVEPNIFTDSTNYLTPVGAFADSPSAYQTFDQNGNVTQWDETYQPAGPPTAYAQVGGSYDGPPGSHRANREFTPSRTSARTIILGFALHRLAPRFLSQDQWQCWHSAV